MSLRWCLTSSEIVCLLSQRVWEKFAAAAAYAASLMMFSSFLSAEFNVIGRRGPSKIVAGMGGKRREGATAVAMAGFVAREICLAKPARLLEEPQVALATRIVAII